MLTFSQDPQIAEQQMRAIIFYLVAFGYIDGDFDASEKTFVKDYIDKLVDTRAKQGLKTTDAATRLEITARFKKHFHEVFDEIDREIQELFTEVVADNESVEEFVLAKLKLRSYEIFRSFDDTNQQELLETVDELIAADGTIHPAEKAFRDEIQALLGAVLLDESELEEIPSPTISIDVKVASAKASLHEDHPLFPELEEHYSSNPEKIREQTSSDLKLINRTLMQLTKQRKQGEGKLTGKQDVSQLGDAPFLDGWTYYHPLEKTRQYEVTVLGDLHGCYSCLKSATLQSDFFAKLEAWRLSPETTPKPLLVLLGDYIDRGRFSYNGVLRAVMQLYLAAPDHVYFLRGNHEYYIEYEGRIYGGVKPAEAINNLAKHAPDSLFRTFKNFFDQIPNTLLLGPVLFVHAGIPRDQTIKEVYKDLSSLNDSDIRFQMMWSDPSSADTIPDDLQKQNARFPFGRVQFERFMGKLGTNMLIRGHEKVEEGFKTIYSGQYSLLNLFSAGGTDNEDLPPNSSYRAVRPMALTLSIADGHIDVTPWPIDYKRFNDPKRNGFFANPPEIVAK